tara:strand:+ start:2221 stop:2712 length:492 start_codon:yes stop_codon:yes gene_type:complete
MSWEDTLKAPPVKRDEAYKNMRGKYYKNVGDEIDPTKVGDLAKKVDEMIKQYTEIGKLKYFVSWEVGGDNISMYYDENNFNTSHAWDDFKVGLSKGYELMENLYRIWKKESDAEVTLTKEKGRRGTARLNDVFILTIKLDDDVEYDNTDEPTVDEPKKRWWKK